MVIDVNGVSACKTFEYILVYFQMRSSNNGAYAFGMVRIVVTS